MRNSIKRTCVLLLAALLLTGCGNSTAETTAGETDTAAAETAAPETETTRAQTKDSLPEDLDFGGLSMPILYRGCEADIIEILQEEELTGEPVSDAVYNRNNSVEERLNVKFAYLPMGTGTADAFPADAKASIVAGSDDFNIVSWNQFSSVALCLENMVMDLQNAPYLDLSQPWWNDEYMEILQIGDQKRFYLMGDICLNALRVTAATFFNQKLYNDVFGDYNDLYELVLEGGWTVDQLKAMGEAGYQDLNGDGIMNYGDIFGIDTTTISHCDYFAYCAGFQVSARDENGMPYLTLQNEHNYNIIDKFIDLYWNSGNGLFIEKDAGGAFNGTVYVEDFSSDTILFMPHWFKICENLRDMESGYGVIPYPKYDESQEDYISLVHDSASLFFLPQTCSSMEESCAVLEAMCAETYRTVMPAYYEVALKRQYARDDISAGMIDLIHDTSMTDFGYVYNYSIGSVGTIMRNVIGKNQNYASAVASVESKAEAQLAELIETYTSLE